MRWWQRWLRSTHQIEADELQARSRTLDATPISQAVLGEPATLAGTVHTVTLRPRHRVPALEAQIYDGSGQLTVVWLGQRQLRGVAPGRPIVVFGRPTRRNGRLMLFNPRYELRPFGQ